MDFGLTGGAVRGFLILVMVAIVLILVLGLVMALLRGEKLRNLIPYWEMLGIALAGAAFVLILVSYGGITEWLSSLLDYPSGNPPPGQGGPGGGLPLSQAFPIGMLLTVLAALAVLIVAFVYHVLPALAHHLSYEEPERDLKRRETLEVVRRGIRDLEGGGDPRMVVLRAYATMCGLIERRGLSRGEFLTPREFQWRARTELLLTEASLRELTSLFEEARYSTHPMGQDQADRALRRLTAVREELEAQYGDA